MAKLIKHVFISDFQIPDHDTQALGAFYNFVKDFAPDALHNVGDFLNCEKVSKYDQNPRYHVNLVDEIEVGRKVLEELVANVRDANSKAEITWYEGNHEERLTKYLAKAPALADLVDGKGEYILAMPHLFDLKNLGVQWVGYNERHTISGGIEIEHGDRVGNKSGVTAHKMMEARGASGVSGHTHRLAYVARSWLDWQSWWIELGSFCKRQFDNPYMRRPGDWQQGFAVGLYDPKTDTMYPSLVPIHNGTFVYGGKLYTA